MPARKLTFTAAVLSLCMASAAAHAQDAPRLPDLRYIALPMVTFHSHNTSESLPVRLYRADGSLRPEALQSLSHLLRDPLARVDSPIVPRTLQLLVRIAHHFDATLVDVVSAYRSTRDAQGQFHRQGYHGEGSAIDFSFPGIPMVDVAAYARTLAHVGVGWYPTSNFVHLDSRSASYYWENHAGRGHTGWDRPLDRADAEHRDFAWQPHDDLPWDPRDQEVPTQLHPRTAVEARLRSGRWVPRHRPLRPTLTVFRGR